MAKFFNIRFLGPETEDALKTLGRLTQTKIEIQEVITVRVECDELAPIVEGMLQTAWAKETVAEPIKGATISMSSIPPSGIKSSTQFQKADQKADGLQPRNCAACGEEYAPSRVDQKYCTRPECKKARQSKFNQEHRARKQDGIVRAQEDPAASAPFAEQP